LPATAIRQFNNSTMATNALCRRFAGFALSNASAQTSKNVSTPLLSMSNSMKGMRAVQCLTFRSFISFQPRTCDKNSGDVRYFSTNLSTSQDMAIGAPVIAAEDGTNVGPKKYMTIVKPDHRRKLKPGLVNRRIANLKTYIGTEKKIRHSPWKLNLICQMAASLPLLEALKQLEFCDKGYAPVVQKVLQRTSNLADIRDGIQQCQLEVAECFATQGSHLKRMKFHGRGRMGIMHHKHSHMRVVLREIDFPLKIYQAPTLYQKKKWVKLQIEARAEYLNAKKERDEMRELEEAARLKKKA